MQNLLHISIGEQFPNTINSIIEIPKDTNAKYEYDVNLGLLKLDRCLISSMRYPASYDDYKVLGIPTFNQNNLNDLSNLDPLLLEVIEDFFEHYKNNDKKKKKTVKINGWIDTAETLSLIRKSHNTYLNRYGKVILKTDGSGNNKLVLG